MRRLVPVLVLALSSVACDAADDDAVSSEQAVEIWPESDENLGYITIVEPTGADKPVDDVKLTFEHDLTGAPAGMPSSLPLTLGTRQRARKGIGVLTLEGAGGRVDVMDVEIRPGQTTTVQLALVALAYDQPSVLAGEPADFGPTKIVRRPTVLFDGKQVSDVDAAGLDGSAQTYAPALPRIHQIQLSVPATYTPPTNLDLTARPMSVQTVDRGPLGPVLPSLVRIDAPARALPDAEIPVRVEDDCGWPARPANLLIATGSYLSSGAGPFYDDASRLCWAGTSFQSGLYSSANYVARARIVRDSQTLKMYPFEEGDAAYHYVLNALFEVPVNPVLGQTVPVRVERIDVHDITVHREDGTVVQDRGLWRLKQLQGADWVPVGPAFPTNTGLDVPPGRYQVTTECVSADCDQHFQTHELDLR